MQIKKYEAKTVQEALDTIKRELGPEAIILQTKKNRKGFGLMSDGSVEVTVAVSERSIQKKKFSENRMHPEDVKRVQSSPSDKQVEVYDKMLEKHLERMQAKAPGDQVQLSSQAQKQSKTQSKITATRYIDIAEIDGQTRLDNKGGQARELDARVHPQRAPLIPAPHIPSLPQAPSSSGERVGLEQELQHLKRIIGEMKDSQDEMRSGSGGTGAQALVGKPSLSTPALLNAYEQLVVNGIDKYYAHVLTKQAAFALGDKACENPDAVLDQMALEIMDNTEVLPIMEGIANQIAKRGEGGPVMIAIVGPTGVGKTTTVAKIASRVLRDLKVRVGLINLDSYKVAAFDQIATYAKILNVPFRSAANADELKLAVQDFKSLDVLLIDTTGRSQKETESLKEMEQLLHSVAGMRTYLALSVATRDAELYEMGRRFSIFRPEGLILSKLDEALMYGSIYNISQRLKLPLSLFTTGQKVPDDIEEAAKERVAALVLDLQFEGAEDNNASQTTDIL